MKCAKGWNKLLVIVFDVYEAARAGETTREMRHIQTISRGGGHAVPRNVMTIPPPLSKWNCWMCRD